MKGNVMSLKAIINNIAKEIKYEDLIESLKQVGEIL